MSKSSAPSAFNDSAIRKLTIVSVISRGLPISKRFLSNKLFRPDKVAHHRLEAGLVRQIAPQVPRLNGRWIFLYPYQDARSNRQAVVDGRRRAYAPGVERCSARQSRDSIRLGH